MEEDAVARALRAVDEGKLDNLGRAVDRALAGYPVTSGGPKPTKNRPGRGLEFLEYRAYAPGDDPRSLDWRATARRRVPQVRQFSDEAYGQWFLCLDRSASMGTPDCGKWLLAVQLVAAWAYLLVRAGHGVGLIAFDDRARVVCPSGRGRSQFQRILSQLALARPEARGGGSNLRDCGTWLGRHTSAAVVSDFLGPDALVDGLDRLIRSKANVQALQVLSPLECSLPFDGPATLVDVETGDRLSLEPGSDVPALAAERLEAVKATLAAHCTRRGVRLTHCQAGDVWSAVVLRHLAGPQFLRA